MILLPHSKNVGSENKNKIILSCVNEKKIETKHFQFIWAKFQYETINCREDPPSIGCDE